MKKVSVFLSLALIAAVLLAACSPAAPAATVAATAAPQAVQPAAPTNPPAAVAPTAAPTTAAPTAAAPANGKHKVVYFIGFGTGTSPSQVDGQKALIKKFNDSHPTIEVELMVVPNGEAVQRFTAMAAAGDPPEILGATGFATIGILGDTGVIEDLGPYIEKSKFDSSIFYGPVVDIMKSFFPTGQKALPLGLYPSFILYNKDMFDAAGLPYPPHAYGDTSWTFDKIRQYGMKMTLDKNGNDATMAAFDPTQIAQWGFDDTWTDMRNYLVEWGAPGVGLLTTPDMKKAIINQKEWVTGLQWLSDGVWKDHFIPNAAGQAAYGAIGNGDPFSTGLASMMATYSWFMPEGLTGINFKYDIAPMPVAPTGKQIVRSDVDGLAMIKGAKEKDAAWVFMSWLVQPEQIVDVCLIYGCLPPVKAVETKFRGIMESKWPGLDYDVIYKGLDHLDNPHSDAYVVEQQKIGDVMNNALSEVYSGSQKDAKVLLDKVNADAQKILDDYWVSH